MTKCPGRITTGSIPPLFLHDEMGRGAESGKGEGNGRTPAETVRSGEKKKNLLGR